MCLEAGATVRENVKLRDLNVAVPAGDERELEVLATGLPCLAGAQLAVDVTLRSPVTGAGVPHARAATTNAVAANAARADKEGKYPELTSSGRCVLIVVALETGGRFSEETSNFLRDLSFARAREAPPIMRSSAQHAWHRRWLRLLACTAARAWCHAVISPTQSTVLSEGEGAAPDLADLTARG